MRRNTRRWGGLLASVAVLFCSGCMTANVNKLYSLPEVPDSYVQLQALLDREIAAGCAYAAPAGGSWRQSVQQVDLNGDGLLDILAFFTDSGGTPKICVYRPDGGGGYSAWTTVTGTGTAVGRVDYADLNADGAQELIVAWQTTGTLRLLSVYALTDGGAEPLLSEDCSTFVLSDLDGNGTEELMDLRADGAVDMLTFSPETASSTAQLTAGLQTLERARTGSLSDGTTALFVEGLLSDGTRVTDVLTVRDGALTCLTPNAQPRAAALWAFDIDADRCLEIPEPEAMGDSGDWLTYWYALDGQGGRSLRQITYHCLEDGWYLTVSQTLADTLTARRDDSVPGQHTVIFSAENADGNLTDVAAVYVFFGGDRASRAQEGGRFILRQDADAVYAARLMDDSLSREQLENSFNLIYSEWQTGAL